MAPQVTIVKHRSHLPGWWEETFLSSIQQPPGHSPESLALARKPSAVSLPFVSAATFFLDLMETFHPDQTSDLTSPTPAHSFISAPKCLFT